MVFVLQSLRATDWWGFSHLIVTLSENEGTIPGNRERAQLHSSAQNRVEEESSVLVP